MPIGDIQPSPENDTLYRKVSATDPEIRALAESIREHGIREPLVVTIDGYILSGHRRHGAAQIAKLKTVPCRVEPIRRADDHDRFIVLLREHNRQRVKSFGERLREELVDINETAAYESLIEHRRDKSAVDAPALELSAERVNRSNISAAKLPMIEAIKAVIKARVRYLPLSDRQIHYALLNNPPLRHASKPESTYANDKQSYKSLVDLLTRARLEGVIPFHAIADETRPQTNYHVFAEPGAFIREQAETMFTMYYRDLMQSQTNHIECVAEKNTVAGLCREVCAAYCIPLTSGRGFCSLAPRHDMMQRFVKSGRAKLVLLLVSDFDPDGEVIAESFARSMRDDFGVHSIHAIKVALTHEQVQTHDLPPAMTAKTTSMNYGKFVEKYGDKTWELEALAPEKLQTILRETIDSVLDIEAFNAELDAERRDSKHLEGVRRIVQDAIGALNLDEGAE